MRLTVFVSIFFLSFYAYSQTSVKSCEIAFAKLVNGRISSSLTGTNKINLWDKDFDVEAFLDGFRKSSKPEKEALLGDLKKLADKSEIYNENLTLLTNKILKENLLPLQSVKKILEEELGGAAKFFISTQERVVKYTLNLDPEKVKFVDDYILSQKLTKNYAKEYRDILLSSNRSVEELKIAIDSGMKLRTNSKDLKQFRNYVEFLEGSKASDVRKAMKDIEHIYQYDFKPNALKPGFLSSASEKFLENEYKVLRYEERRFNEILEELKISEKDPHLKDSLVKRAKAQAAGEAEVFQKLRAGCNSGKGGAKLDAAKKKFRRFKMGLSLASTPLLYYMKNKDKLDTDPFWFERLGYEMGMGIVFTWVGNKIITGTDSSFWKKYLQGQMYGAALDAPNALGYDMLFGKNGYARYVKNVYSNEYVESKVEKEFNALKNSENFEEDVKALFLFLEERSKEFNTKNFLNKYFNLSAYDSSMDPDKITREDLESEEAQEMMMELLAERMYLQNMGNWPIFQTGSTGADRWAFYRMNNISNGLKGLVLDLTIFRILCLEPAGPVGSFGLAMGIILADKLFLGDFTYTLRRDAINQ